MIRFATTADIPAILDIYAPYIINTGYSFEYAVPTREEFSKRFAHHTAYCPWLVWEENGQVLGYAYGAPAFERAAYSWCAEVSIYLSSRIQDKGVGKKLYTVLESILFMQGYQVIYAIITSENEASIAFHQALGYRQVAQFDNCGIKFGRRLGTIWLEKCRISAEVPTKMPVHYTQIVENDEKLKNILAILSLS